MGSFFPGGFRLPPDFYHRYWQKEPLVIRGALADFRSPLSPDELAGLACMDGVDARIVVEHGGNAPWEVRYGPFAQEIFSSMPKSHWTLLIQAVDHWDEKVAALRRLFPLIANWRIDDVMVSYACDRGSVGPHYDQYDVFLLQGMGRRRWRLGGPVARDAAFEEGLDLHLLKGFRTQAEYLLEVGDALYLPPGHAHWGIADGECVTYSIGFRAPAHGEIIEACSVNIADRLREDQRYRDRVPDASGAPHPGEITPDVIGRLHDIVIQHLTHESVAQWFGAYVTDPKYPEATGEFDAADAVERLAAGARCVPRPGSRFAFMRRADGLDLYADGRRFACPVEAEPWVLRLCDGESVGFGDGAEYRAVVVELLRHGSIEFG